MIQPSGGHASFAACSAPCKEIRTPFGPEKQAMAGHVGKANETQSPEAWERIRAPSGAPRCTFVLWIATQCS